ncbi:MAG: hypothetical protein LBS96_07945 [Oscillospiraceae bacterium]|jgi:ABC-2 type transport system permease protein|nr:hypothetical protein [Oscillospiraceae bacterium]
MFSKPILKQTFKSSYKLWVIFTAILCVISAVVISVFDPKMISGMMKMLEGTPMAEMAGDRLSSMTSLLGMLSQQFYGMLAAILPMIYIIITANNLIASQVDRGSMAYLLSTPTKRSTVVRTQASFLIGSVFAMFLVVTIVGLGTVQLMHHALWGEGYTPDVVAAAKVLDVDKADLTDDLSLILDNEEALATGADAREIETDVYTMYLTLKMADDTGELPQFSEQAGQVGDMQNQIISGITAAADVLGVAPADLMSDMGKIKANSAALAAAAETSGLPEPLLVMMINSQLASDELALDAGIEFSVKDYLMLNLGAFLLMFAISAISFLFSCIFNLSKNSLALGAGIPIAFFVFQIMAQIGDSLSGFKYLSLNTLFDTNAIVNGGSYAVQFVVLAVIGVVLYVVGMNRFQQKDLPL